MKTYTQKEINEASALISKAVQILCPHLDDCSECIFYESECGCPDIHLYEPIDVLINNNLVENNNA